MDCCLSGPAVSERKCDTVGYFSEDPERKACLESLKGHFRGFRGGRLSL